MQSAVSSKPIQTSAFERWLIDLWEDTEMMLDDKLERQPCGLLYFAWNHDQERTAMKFIVSEPIERLAFDDLVVDLGERLTAEHKLLLAEAKERGHSDEEALELVWTAEADHVDVYFLESRIDDATRMIALSGAYAPEVYLHVVPNRLVQP